MSRPRPVAMGIVLVLLAAVWAVPSGWSAVADDDDDDADGRWRLQPGGHGVGSGLVLDVHGDEVTGRAPCNGFRADWSEDDGPSELLSSAARCAPVVDREENLYYDLLASVSAVDVDVDGDRLRLVGPRGVLVYVRES